MIDKLNFNNAFGWDTEYKGVKIKPIKMKNCLEFYDAVRCLLIEKNKQPDPEIIKMSYFKFLIELILSGHTYLYEMLQLLFKLSMDIDLDLNRDLRQTKRGGYYLEINKTIDEENTIIKILERDFDKISNIICEQNVIDNEEDTILDPEFEKTMRETEEYFQKQKEKMATLEERIIIYHCLTGVDFEDIAEKTIYQFNKVIERFNVITEYKILRSAELSGMVEFKQPYPHMMSHIRKKGKYEDLLMSKDKFDKIAQSVN